MTTKQKDIEKAEESKDLPSSSLEETNLEEPQEEEKGLLDTLGDKKKEAEKLDQESVDLAQENQVDIEADLLTKGEKFLAAIAYLSFLCILPLVLKQDSKFCQFHGKQGLVLLVFWLGLGFFAELIKPFSYFVWLVLTLTYIGFAFYGIYLGFTGQKKEIPMIGRIAKTLTW